MLFGGSTHRGEEEILARIFLRLRQQFPSLRLFIAPRHVERLREIRAQLSALPLRMTLASEALTGGEVDADCMLLDTTGELQRWYGIATVVFMGKSLDCARRAKSRGTDYRGQTSRVWSAHGKFRYTGEGAGFKERRDPGSRCDSLEHAVAELLRDSEARQRLVNNAREVLSEHQGATARAATLIHELIQSKPLRDSTLMETYTRRFALREAWQF